MGFIKKVTFFGYAEAEEGGELYESARESAKLLAQEGYTIVNGGGPGVMKAATVGAHEGGGKAIGVTFYPKDIMHFEGRDPENEFDEEVVTDNYVARTLKLMEIGQIFVTFNGGAGTLSEFGMAWGLARLYFGHHKPLILFGRFWEEVVNSIAHNLNMRPWDRSILTIIEEPKGVLRAVQAIDNQETLERQQGLVQEEGPFTL